MLRLLAELTVLFILATLPVLLLCAGKFWALHAVAQAIVCLLSPLAIGLIIAIGFLPWKVVVDASGLQMIALFKSQQVEWARMQTLRLKSNWGWRRYVITLDSGEASFPFWLKDVGELIDIVRARLPERGRSQRATNQSYRLDLISKIMQLGQAVAQMLFITVFWLFFFSLKNSRQTSSEDGMLVLGAGIIFSLVMLRRLYFIARMPYLVEVTPEGISSKSYFGDLRLTWSEIKGVATANLFLPEGLLVKSRKKNLLIGNSLDSFDELEEELKRRI